MFIVVTGPESSGKTTLSEYLGEYLPALVVHEYSRRYLERIERRYDASDVIAIGRVQFESVQSALRAVRTAVVSDTFMLELKVWTEVRFDGEPESIREMRHALPPDIYVLCRPDLPWEPDPLRENPHDRDSLFERYKKYVHDSGVDFVEAYGKGPDRMERVVESIRQLIKKAIP